MPPKRSPRPLRFDPVNLVNPVLRSEGGGVSDMNTQRHAVRKLDFSESNDFDERLWPVNLALLLAWGCVAGMIWAACDFQTPVWYQNGYFWVFVLTASVLSLGGLAIYFGGRSARRPHKAAFFKLAVHRVRLSFLQICLVPSPVG